MVNKYSSSVGVCVLEIFCTYYDVAFLYLREENLDLFLHNAYHYMDGRKKLNCNEKIFVLF